jgi:hypothetical protein
MPKHTCKNCTARIRWDSATGLCLACYRKRPTSTVDTDRATRRTEAERSQLRQKYDAALKTIDRQERELRSMNVLGQGLDTFTIEPKTGHRTSEGTVIALASDWHVEEKVGAEVGGLNTYSLDIAKARIEKFFQGIIRLTALLHQDINVTTLVLALLGDFISNDIHEDFPEINELQPMHALVFVQNHLISGIEFLLAHTPEGGHFDIVVVCHSGNHARTTHKTRFSAENGHSLEYLLYLHLAAYFRDQPRVKFIIPEGMHSYLDIYGTTIRFQHGHAIRYAGGVGGIYIPVNKAIAQWNKARHADLDVFGHYHQLRDGGNFICNGSLIGYNAFALSIKADYEPPKQALFLMDRKRGRTCTWPILVS